jgi:hypothetical protein
LRQRRLHHKNHETDQQAPTTFAHDFSSWLIPNHSRLTGTHDNNLLVEKVKDRLKVAMEAHWPTVIRSFRGDAPIEAGSQAEAEFPPIST